MQGFGRLVVKIAYVTKFLKAVLLVCASLREDLWSDAKEDAPGNKRRASAAWKLSVKSNECSAARSALQLACDVPCTKHWGLHSN